MRRNAWYPELWFHFATEKLNFGWWNISVFSWNDRMNYLAHGMVKRGEKKAARSLFSCASWEHRPCTVLGHTVFLLSTSFSSSQLVPGAELHTGGPAVFFLLPLTHFSADCALILMSVLWNTVHRKHVPTHSSVASFAVPLKYSPVCLFIQINLLSKIKKYQGTHHEILSSALQAVLVSFSRCFGFLVLCLCLCGLWNDYYFPC